jgi:alkylation response protein AidB-like acyl-CoA dehydrogenase
MRFDWTEEQSRFRAELRDYATAAEATSGRGVDLRDVASDDSLVFASEFTRGLAQRGWLAPHWPVEHGGNDDSWQHIILGEELWARGEPRGPQYMNVNWVAPLIMMAGTEAQKEEHLNRIRNADVIWCQGFSEPEAGSDLAALRTTGRRDGDEYIVDGQKIWTSYAHVADFCFLLVRTRTDVPNNQGITILLVPMDTPGIEVREIEGLAGPHQFHEVFFTDVRVPVEHRLGEENRGWELVRRGLAYERVGSPRYAAATVELDRLVDWARERDQLDDPAVLLALGTARAACDAARMLTYRAIDDRAKGIDAGSNANVARVAMVRAERAVAAAATRIQGPYGLVRDTIADRQWLSAKVAGIASGAYEIQLALIAGGGLGLARDR